MKKTFLILITSIFFFSCESKLTNEEAKEAILKDYVFYHCKGKLDNSNINADFVNGKPLSNQDKRVSTIHNELEKKGYIYLTDRKYSSVGVVKTLNLTEKSKRYDLKNNNVIVTYERFGEIIGVSQEGDNATVLFSIINEESPFIELFPRTRCAKGTIQKEAKLTRFDTGWKLTKQ